MIKPVAACADWLEKFLRQQGPTSLDEVLAAAEGAGFPAGLVTAAARPRHVGVVKVRVGTASTWALPGPLSIVRASSVAIVVASVRPWPGFPHCTSCHERLWATTFRRHPSEGRGPLLLPDEDGYCPHCECRLYEVPSPQADAMADMIRSMR